MQRCPTCQLTYVDPTLRYCLEDGTALINDPSSAADQTLSMDAGSPGGEPPPTEILDFGVPPTVRSYEDEATAQRIKAGATARQQARRTINDFPNVVAGPAPLARKTTSVVAITAIATVLVLAVGGLGAWLLMRDKGTQPGTNTRVENGSSSNTSNTSNNTGPGSMNGNSNGGSVVTSTPLPTPTPPTTPTVTPQPTASTDSSSARREVLEALNGWTETMRRADLNGHMAYYASTLHTYYNARNYSSAGVRANVARAFAKYSSFDVKLSNVQVDVDPSGTSAIASFTKSFVFSGGADPYTGSGLNRFWFEKIGGRWLITGEKDLGN
ncbi:MAG: hypothetical protein QOJ64_1078 [Acidobacteriota bacterium]|jgi:hypothetical protein|nr:hypothetical protein [Acidobacteriota bacterium]